MKKILAFALALLLVVSLAACGGSDGSGSTGENNNSGAESKANDTESKADDAESKASGHNDGVTDYSVLKGRFSTFITSGDTTYFDPATLTAEQKEVLQKIIADEGGTLTFRADGTMDINQGGVKTVIYTNGDVEATNSDGDHFLMTHSWPKTGLATSVPDPGIKVDLVIAYDHMLTVTFKEGTVEDAKDYAAKLKAAGYTEYAEEDDDSANGMYSYYAMNSDLYSVDLNYVEAYGYKSFSLAVTDDEDDGDDDYSYDFDYSYDDDYSYDEEYSYDYDYSIDWGETGLYNDSWPTDSFSALMPRADFCKNCRVTEDENTIQIDIPDVTKENYESYVRAVKAMGYTVDADTEDFNGVAFYTAADKSGIEIYVQYTSGYMVIALDCSD